MSRYSWKAMLPFTVLLMLLLAACGSSSATQTPVQSTPTPAPAQGQELLTKAGQNLRTAKTLHAIFDITIVGTAVNGAVSTEVWNVSPDKSRTVVLQSTIKQFSTGSITVSNGKQVWQYDHAKKVVYTGQVSNSTGSGSGNFNYNGDVYIDKASMLPLQVKLTIQGFGQVTLGLPTLVLNQPVDNSLFIFVPPTGVQVLPFPKTTTSDTGAITLEQAQQQAGYHLLSIPSSHTEYQLQGVDALGAPGNQIFTLNFAKGNTTFAISEGKSLANLPVSGQQVSVRGTTATLSLSGNTITLTWTEKGVGMQIAGNVSKDELLTIANLLA